MLLVPPPLTSRPLLLPLPLRPVGCEYDPPVDEKPSKRGEHDGAKVAHEPLDAVVAAKLLLYLSSNLLKCGS